MCCRGPEGRAAGADGNVVARTLEKVLITVDGSGGVRVHAVGAQTQLAACEQGFNAVKEHDNLNMPQASTGPPSSTDALTHRSQ